MTMGELKIENRDAGVVRIDVEGVIGVPEKAQPGRGEDRVATYGAFRKQLEAVRAP